eukprot:TRINITY_DN39369_c0_g1_i1.p1 TRINITY_DN39369_c0_g1~~TRINITY_DN39369_c0_g1_i1.p1  ORF type:complete len:413 (+),score=160.22 TRINITY_DN39369_c0_g1_i1:76-1314(+)
MGRRKGGAKGAAAAAPAAAQQGGKKKGGKKAADEEDIDIDALCQQLKEVTGANTSLVEASSQRKPTKKEREEYKATLKENKSKEESQLRDLAMLQDYLRRMSMDSPYLDAPIKKKQKEETDSSLFLCSAVGMQGWRRHMEDAHVVAPSDGEKEWSDFAVFDGHNGPEVAKFAADHLNTVLDRHRSAPAKPAAEIGDELIADYDDEQRRLYCSFVELDSMIRKESLDAGSTATMVSVNTKNKTVYGVNAGDSRAVMCCGGEAVALSEDHKPTNDGEKARIEAAGSYVGQGRVEEKLAVSRGLGDFCFKEKADLPPHKQPVSCAPEVWKRELTADCEFIVVACDGIWDVLSSDEVVKRVRAKLAKIKQPTSKDLTRISCDMMDSICSKGPAELGSDNMTMVIALPTDELRQRIK